MIVAGQRIDVLSRSPTAHRPCVGSRRRPQQRSAEAMSPWRACGARDIHLATAAGLVAVQMLLGPKMKMFVRSCATLYQLAPRDGQFPGYKAKPSAQAPQGRHMSAHGVSRGQQSPKTEKPQRGDTTQPSADMPKRGHGATRESDGAICFLGVCIQPTL